MKELSVNGNGLSTMCRLCLAAGVPLMSIFHSSAKLRNQLADIIMECAPVQIRNGDKMPNFICQLCHSQLESMHRFRLQIVQSEKTLRYYLDQLHIYDRQIKPEYYIEEPSNDHLIHKTNADVAVKRESFEQFDMFDMTIKKEKTATNYNAANKIKKDTSLNSEIEVKSMIDNSLTLIQSSAATVETLFKEDGSDISCEDTKIGFGHVSENVTPFRSTDGIEYFDNGEEGNNTHTGEKKHRCDICNRCFSQTRSLNNHKRIHTGEKPYQCDICNKYFHYLCNLKIHIRTHTGEKPYQCDICNKCFSQTGSLNSHKQIHTGEKPQCEICNKRLSRSSDLNRHKRTHTGQKPYQCDICNKCFSQTGSLNSHKWIHTGEKPHQCDICNKCFSQTGSLNSHKRIHTGEKPYQCDNCNKCFNQSSHLNVHKRIHTGEKPNQRNICKK